MKRFAFSLLALFCALDIFAQNTLKLDAPNVVTADETFRIVFTANGRMSDFEWEGTSDFDVVWGPQKGSMSSTNIVNGKRTSTHEETVTYLLQPKSTGTFTIKGATAKVSKESCASQSATIEVVAAESPATHQPAQQQNSQQSQASSSQTPSSQASSSQGDIFLKLSLSKTSVVKGEPITATLKIYTRTDIGGFEDIHFPTFNGFWSKETVTVNNLEFNRENVDGAIYNSALLRKYMLIPQQSGTLTIDPAEMVCQIRVRTASSGPHSIFDDFFDNYQTVRKRISTPEIKVSVRELPAGAPASFKGGVGSFKISAQLSKGEIKSNDAASLTVTVSGNGNVSMLEAPKINFPPDFEVYDLKSSDKIASDGASGSKTFEFPFIPRSHGDFTIPSIEYSYYDIAKGKYETLSTGDIAVHVEKGTEIEGGGVAVAGVNRQGVRNLSEDIRYIRLGDGGLRRKDSFFAGSLLFYILAALIVILYFVCVRVLKFSENRRADVVGTRNRRANKMARARLRTAGDYLAKGLSSAYYEELHKALLGYVSDKLAIPAASLSKDSIAEGLALRGVSQKTVDDFTALVDRCEFARYSPDNEAEQQKGEYNEAIRIISQLESEVKKSHKTSGAAVAVVALLSLSINASAQADGVAGLWQKAGEAYAAEQWQNALNYYQMIEGENLQSDDLYYNMGNAYFKLGDNSHAILYYEKALKLNPSHEDAANNLSIASQMTLDKIESVPEFFLSTWISSLRNSMSADGWAYLALALLLVAAVLLVIFKFAGALAARKVSFILSIVLAVLSVSSFILSISSKRQISVTDSAIVISPVSSVKSSPSEGGNPIFVLHEGTKVTLLDEVGDWEKIEIADGRQGWLQRSTIEAI